MSSDPSPAIRFLAIGVLVLGLVVLCFYRISDTPIEKDPAQITLMAFNLDRHGVISMEETPPFHPTNYREPGPILVSAAAIALIDAKLGKAATADAYYSGERVRLLKYQNIAWLLLLSLSALWAARILGASFYVALLASVFATYPYWGSHTPLNDLYTELPAAAFLMLASATLALAFRRRSPALCALAGLLFGILTLVKAAILYVFAGMAVVMACLYLWEHRAVPIRFATGELAALVLAFGFAVAPWMVRNSIQMGSPQISQRGGVVLMFRAVDDQMTPEEYRGTFYVYAPPRVQGIIGRMLGFSPADLQRNGRLQRLNDEDSDFAAEDLAAEKAGAPEKTISFYRRARAERVKMENVYYAAGGPHPEIAADGALKKVATGIIAEHPWMHLALTVPFLWRGATLVFPVLVITLVYAMRKRRYELLIFGLPAFGAVMLYALLTHFIGRYDVPSLTVAIVVLIVSLATTHPQASRQTNGAVARSFG